MTATFFPVLTSDDPPAAPPGWKWRLLGDVARLESGHTPSRREPAYWEGGNIPWLSLKDIRGLAGRYVVETQDKPAQKGIDNSSARVLPKGTVAFCRTASVGKVAILGRDMATSQDFANWVCGPDLLPEYLYEALKASGGQFDKEKQGSTHKTIYMPVLERFRVLLPPLSEQRRIADILDKADAIRRKRKEAIALTEELLRSAFLEMFGDPVTNPKGWPVKPLGELLATDPRIGTLVPASNGPGRLVVRVGELGAYDVGLSRSKRAELADAELQRFGLKTGDVLLARAIGSEDHLGKASVMQPHDEPVAFDSHVMRLRFRDDVLDPYVFVQWLRTPGGRARFMNEAGRTAVQFNVNGKQIVRVQIPLPPRPEQRRFRGLFDLARATQRKSDAALGESDDLFNSLVARAFSGALESSR